MKLHKIQSENALVNIIFCAKEPFVQNPMTPREIVAELDRYIIGQDQAKRMVAVAMRNRWRRQLLEPALREEVAPKNIIMIGPTGVGKTEIARRLARLCSAPFLKIEATKYTEVGYVGRDVESMVRDLMEIGIGLVRDEENTKVKYKAQERAEERLLDLLLPRPSSTATPGGPQTDGDSAPAHSSASSDSSGPLSTREKLRKLLREGHLNEREVDMEVEMPSQQIELLSMPGMDDMGSQFQDIFSKIMPSRRKRRRIKVSEAFELLVQEESERLIDHDKVVELARERVEQSGIIFIDELDKIATSGDSARNADVSREGVQRDLLPIVEGSSVKTKHGMVRTDHILFIAAGAFHFSKPSDLIPELQGRFPLRVELAPLYKKDFYRILTEPNNALTKQYTALLGTEGVNVEFSDDGLEEIAAVAEFANQEMENIGARRLYTILEKILADLSFEAPEKKGETVLVNKDYVQQHIEDILKNKDLGQYIL